MTLLGRQPAKSGSQSVTTAEATACIKPVGNVITNAHADVTDLSRASDDVQILSLDDRPGSIGVRPDSEQQQLYSCVANGGLYNGSDVWVLAMVLHGAGITEVFNPERVAKLCSN